MFIRSERTGLEAANLFAGVEAITHPGIGHNVARGIWRGLELLAELRDEYAEVLNLFGIFTTPNRTQQRSVGNNFAGVAGEIYEQVKLFRSEMHGAVFDKNASCARINFEISRLNRREFRLVRLYAAKIGADARQKFLDAEGLGYVVIRAGIESLDLGLFLAPHRKHNDRNLRLRSQPAAQFESIHVGHCQIGNDQVRC